MLQQYSTVHSTVQYTAVQYRFLRQVDQSLVHPILVLSTVALRDYLLILYCTTLYSTVQCCTVLYWSVLYCTVLYFTVMCCKCTVLYYIGPLSLQSSIVTVHLHVINSQVHCKSLLYCTVLYCILTCCDLLDVIYRPPLDTDEPGLVLTDTVGSCQDIPTEYTQHDMTWHDTWRRD